MKNKVSEKLKILVEEILKKKPDQSVVEQLMSDYGLHYSPDPIIQMSTILDSMTKIKFKKKNAPEAIS